MIGGSSWINRHCQRAATGKTFVPSRLAKTLVFGSRDFVNNELLDATLLGRFCCIGQT
jgi:hypothetical protein